MGLEIERVYIKDKIISQAGKSHVKNETEIFALKIKIQNMLIQNTGILIGFILMLLLGLYADKIAI